jgi:hypothetical protein
MNRFDHTISTVSLEEEREVDVVGVAGRAGFDPSPEAVRSGRRLLYDARGSSGHGDLSCGTCHVFGHWDGIAWDLGDPLGEFVRYADAPWVEFKDQVSRRPGFHPMKGPMVTQTLRGLRGMEPFHWRGDRRDFQHFNGAFVSLLGRDTPLEDAAMDAFAEFIMTVELPPNPNRALDDSLSQALPLPTFSGNETVQTGDAQHGEFIFTHVDTNPGGTSACVDCHALPAGTLNKLQFLPGRPQDIKIASLRTVYEKVRFAPLRIGLVTPVGPREQASGVGMNHAGSVSLNEFLVGFGSDVSGARDIAAFLLSFPTGMPGCVGQQVTLRRSHSQEDLERSRALLAEAEARRCDVIAKGRVGRAAVGFAYDPELRLYVPDSSAAALVDPDALLERLRPGDALTLTAVPTGSGLRMGIDRDRDGCLDGDEHRSRAHPWERSGFGHDPGPDPRDGCGDRPARPPWHGPPCSHVLGGPREGPGCFQLR